MSSLIFTGGTGSPYRPPCGGWPTGTGPVLFGGCGPCSSAGIYPKLKNTTTVPNFADGGATAIGPYTRPVFDPSSANCGGTNQIPCAPWPEPVPQNTYAPYSPAQTMDFSTIPKLGFKNVFARKAWHGRFGFLSGDSCCDSGFKPAYSPAPDTTKYLTITWDAKLKLYDPTGATVVTEFAQSGSCSVNRYSGRLTCSASNSASGAVKGQDPGDPTVYTPGPGASFPAGNQASAYLLDYILGGFDACIRRFPTEVPVEYFGDLQLRVYPDHQSLQTGDTIVVVGATSSVVNGTHTVTVVNNNTISLNGVPNTEDATGAWFYALKVSPAPPLPYSPALNSFDEDERDLLGYGVDPDTHIGRVVVGTPLTLFSVTNTEAKLGVGVDSGLSSFTATFFDHDSTYAAWYVHITLSDPYTNDDLNTDLNTLLAKWDLTDDSQYPWRSDKLCTAGPLLTFFETSPTAPTIYVLGHTDTNPQDGSLLGTPNPAGYDPFFNFRANVFEIRTNIFGGHFYQLTGKGELAPDWARHATQWTSLADQLNFFPGCFREFSAGVLSGSKWAEVKLPWFSHNFARPCGTKDLETRDESTLNCASDGHGGYVNEHGNLRWPGKPCFCNDPTQTTGCGTATNPTAVNGWNDNPPKGDWCLLTWTSNYREDYANSADPNYRPASGPLKTVNMQQQCSATTICGAPIIYLGPDSASFPTPNLACDGCYGSLWQQAAAQFMADPLWVPPHRPCSLDGGIAWTEDDGTGHLEFSPDSSGTESKWFPMRPMEECRAAKPTGAPDLAAGQLGTTSVADLNAGSTAQFVFPPVPPVITALSDGSCFKPVGADQNLPAWLIAANILNNINTTGRFSCDYKNPLDATCADDPEVIPP